MLAVPGWSDSHNAPNALPVASALKMTARVSGVWSRSRVPSRHAMTK